MLLEDSPQPGSHGSGQPLVSRYWTAARKSNLRKYHRALLAALAGGVDNMILIQYHRQNKNFSYHFRLESKNSPLCVQHTRRSGCHLSKIPASPQLFYYVCHFAALFLVVSLESTLIKPLSRLASTSVTRSQWLAKTTVHLPWPEPRDPGVTSWKKACKTKTNTLCLKKVPTFKLSVTLSTP